MAEWSMAAVLKTAVPGRVSAQLCEVLDEASVAVPVNVPVSYALSRREACRAVRAVAGPSGVESAFFILIVTCSVAL
jgi:hypothetical protein